MARNNRQPRGLSIHDGVSGPCTFKAARNGRRDAEFAVPQAVITCTSPPIMNVAGNSAHFNGLQLN